jgi:N-acyl-D-amino-acid deacylase
MKKLIKNGFVIDGSGEKRYKADVLVNGDKIEKIGAIDNIEGAEVIDATGKIVAPGFIDTHSHSDLKVLIDHLLNLNFVKG